MMNDEIFSVLNCLHEKSEYASGSKICVECGSVLGENTEFLDHQFFWKYKMDLLQINEDYFKEQDRLRSQYLFDKKHVQLLYESKPSLKCCIFVSK